MQLTKDQNTSLEEILDFLNDEEKQFFTLQGYAGTGKTTLLAEVVEKAKDLSLSTIITAPTNKAVKVLREKIPNTKNSTIHSLLNIRPVPNGKIEIFKQVTFNKQDILDYDLIIIDECSMVSKKLLRIIIDSIGGEDVKVLFCGDSAQLQPINESISATFEYPKTVLSEIVRYGNAIAKQAAVPRNSLKSLFMSDLVHEPDIIISNAEEVYSLFSEQFSKNPDHLRLLAWRNKTVAKHNFEIRKRIFGDASQAPYLVGETLMANSPCFSKGDYPILNNSEECTILEVSETYEGYQVKAVKENGNEINLNIVKKEYQPQLKKDLDAYAAAKNWKAFWALNKSFHDVRHCYCITIHKSQGSTYDNVIIDFKDASTCSDAENRNQLIYVAMTRTKETVRLI